MKLREKAARGAFWLAAGRWGYQLTTLVVFALLSRLLTPEAFGLVGLASIFTGLMRLIAEQGMADALVQRSELEPEHLDTAFWLSLGFGAGLSGLLVATSGIVAGLVNEADVAPVISWLSPLLVLSGLSSVQRAILTREFRFASLTLRTLSSVVVGGVAGVVAALRGLGVWSLVVQLLTIEAVSLITLWAASDWRPRLRFSWRHLRDLLSFGANVVGFRLLRFFNTRIDKLIVGSVLGATALGFYVVAFRLLELLIDVTTSIIGGVAFPVFSHIQGDHGRVRNVYYQSIRLSGVLAFPAFLGIVVVAPEVTRLVFGPQWDASVPVMRVLAIAGVVTTMVFINGSVMKALGKPSWRLGVMVVTAAMLLLGFTVAVNWGIVAVAVAFTCVTCLMAPLWLLGPHKLIQLEAPRYVRQVGPSFIASLVMMISVFALKGLVSELPLLWQVVLLVATGIAAYLTTLWYVGRPVFREVLDMARLAIPGPRSSTPPPERSEGDTLEVNP